MWADTEESRSDFILAGAVAIFGPLLYFFVIQVFPVRRLGLVGALVEAILIFAIAGLVPLLLARYREQGAAAFGLDVPVREGISAGLLVAAPAVAVGLLALFRRFGAEPLLLVGELRLILAGPAAALVLLVQLAAIFVGALLLYTFLTAKARHGFARNEIPQLEALRTFGMGAAGVGVVLGLLVAAQGRIALSQLFLEGVALVVIVLLTDRLVASGATTTRATVLAPAIVALIVRVELFGPTGFLFTLRQAVLGAGLVVVLVILLETRRYAWAAVPILAAVLLYPSGLRPFLRLVG
jgi:hypothetical protein